MRKFEYGRFLCALTGSLLLVASTYVEAQSYPNKPIKIVMPYAPGGEMDRIARIFAEKFKDKLGQTTIVENRGGAGGNIGAEMTINAPPDGHTLMFGATAQVVTNKLLYQKLNYDPDTFSPISLVSSSSTVLVAHPKVSFDTTAQLIASAKANPSKISYVTGGVGTSTHLSTELFANAAGIKLLHVPYKSSSVALPDIISGQVNMGFFAPSLVIPLVREGRLKVIAVGSEKRNSLFPNVPALSETVPGIVAVTWYAMVAPPSTPPAIVNRLAVTIKEILAMPDVSKQFADLNIEVIGSTPAEMAIFVQQERERWTNVIRSTGIKAE